MKENTSKLCTWAETKPFLCWAEGRIQSLLQFPTWLNHQLSPSSWLLLGGTSRTCISGGKTSRTCISSEQCALETCLLKDTLRTPHSSQALGHGSWEQPVQFWTEYRKAWGHRRGQWASALDLQKEWYMGRISKTPCWKNWQAGGFTKEAFPLSFLKEEKEFLLS